MLDFQAIFVIATRIFLLQGIMLYGSAAMNRVFFDFKFWEHVVRWPLTIRLPSRTVPRGLQRCLQGFSRTHTRARIYSLSISRLSSESQRNQTWNTGGTTLEACVHTPRGVVRVRITSNNISSWRFVVFLWISLFIAIRVHRLLIQFEILFSWR